MSGIADDDEIDKVVSSVRKLVTRGDDDTGFDAEDASEEEEAVLVLTPSLRVEDEPEPDGPVISGDNVVLLDRSQIVANPNVDPTFAQLATAVDKSEPSLEEAAWAAETSASDIGSSDDDDTDPSDDDISPPDTAVTDHVTDQSEDESVKDHAEDDPAMDDETASDRDDEPVESEPLLTQGDDKEADLGAFFSAEAALDRELLRQMVIEIIQEELRGDMGHKITGTVRKLVRREMSRIMASRELN